MSINVDVFSSPGCNKCSHAKSVIKKVCDEIGSNVVQWREVNVIEELDYAVELGVLSLPAIAIDGQLVFSSLPSVKKLRAELLSRINASNDTRK